MAENVDYNLCHLALQYHLITDRIAKYLTDDSVRELSKVVTWHDLPFEGYIEHHFGSRTLADLGGIGCSYHEYDHFGPTPIKGIVKGIYRGGYQIVEKNNRIHKFSYNDDGELDGPYIEYEDGYKDNMRVKCHFKDGKLHGPLVDSVEGVECTFVDGKLDGIMRIYRNSETIPWRENTYANGEYIRYQHFDEDSGELVSEYYYDGSHPNQVEPVVYGI